MAVYNGSAYLRQAVESILAQTFRDFEFLIINDGSTDDSRAILKSYDDPRIRTLDNHENSGLTRSLNCGLEVARGELIARQDADDVSHPTRLARQVAFLETEHEVGAVGTQARYINRRGRIIHAYGWDKLCSGIGLAWQLMFDSPFVHSSVMFRRRAVWETEGGYNESFTTNQDFELWSRLARKHQLRNLPESLVDLRLHQASVSANYSGEKVAKVRDILRANLQANLPEYPAVEEWLDLWIRLNNQRAYRLRPCASEVLSHLRRIRILFLERYPSAMNNSEINRHTAALHLRGAFATTAAGLPGAMRFVRRAAYYDAALTLSAAPRLAGNMLRRAVAPRTTF